MRNKALRLRKAKGFLLLYIAKYYFDRCNAKNPGGSSGGFINFQ